MTWLSAAVRIGTLLAVCASVGWYYGKPLVAVTCALAGLVVLWLYQMYRVQQWLRESGRPPPEIYGIWGDLLSQIHQLQKRGGEARFRRGPLRPGRTNGCAGRYPRRPGF